MRNKYLHLLLVSNALLALDQFTKHMIVSRVPLHYSITVVEEFFNITHIRNSGVAFGLFAGDISEYKWLFFVLVSSVAIVAILVFFHQTPDDKRMVQNALTLILSGAIGNLIDRVLYREVVDFLDFFYKDYHWPAFNVADSCITIGVSLMILDLFQKESREPSPVSPSEKIEG